MLLSIISIATLIAGGEIEVDVETFRVFKNHAAVWRVCPYDRDCLQSRFEHPGGTVFIWL